MNKNAYYYGIIIIEEGLYMKKVYIILVLLLSIFISSSVDAKSVDKLCNYNNSDNTLAQYGDVNITIYEDG